ncbi:unnamed protein product [Rhizophagus irregularis]|nr:unnamed protein product [Rhizophagus irregularis]
MNKIKYLFKQIKDFSRYRLTIEQEEQELLIDKQELKECYKEYGLCKICNQPKTDYIYCRSCNSQYFKQNFKNWTSGNHDVDEFIQKAQLKAKDNDHIIEWIEYDKFEDVEYLAKGGFGTTFKAIWKDGPCTINNSQLERQGETKVALKCLYNSQDITDFLKEVESNILVYITEFVVRCFGITKDPKTNNFIMVMELKNGSLRQYLDNNFILLIWEYKLLILAYISHGLDYIHTNGLIHQDFHCGNILSNFNRGVAITELGLCQPANVKSSQNTQNINKKIYGVLPYVAPEVLRGKEYTQKSNIYGFGIIAYEIWTGFPPYYDIAHDDFLAMKICNGLRPKSNYKIPQLIFDIINQCWDADPSKRPSSDELVELFDDLWKNIFEKNCIIKEQINDADEINKNSSSSFSTAQSPLSSTGTLQYTTHPQAVYISRILDFKNLPEPKNANSNDDLLGIEHSDKLYEFNLFY